MPTNRTKRTRHHAGLDYWKLEQLVTGAPLIAGVGYGAPFLNGCNYWTEEEWAAVDDAMRADWQLHGAAFMAWWRGETETYTAAYAAIGGQRRAPSVTPWALTKFGEP
jgi:hypothetical protein